MFEDERRKICSTSRRGAGASYQTSHPGISARAIAFGRSWPFTAFCYRPRLPVRHWGRDMSAPKPYETNPTPTHSSKPPLSSPFPPSWIRGRGMWYKLRSCKTMILTISLVVQLNMSSIVGIEEPEYLRTRWWNVSTREKNAVPPDTGAGASHQTSHPGISAHAITFGRSWPFAAFCYRPCLPVRHLGRDMSVPKPYVTNPPPTHSSKPPLSI